MSLVRSTLHAALTLADVGCARGDRLLFGGVSTSVGAGRLLRVQGANGVGKTTLLRTIAGLAMPAQGRIAWRGGPVLALRETGSVAYLGHAPALKGDLTALENLRAHCGLAGVPCSDRDATVALAHAGLRGREHLPVRVLSQGQRKRAALARLSIMSASPGLCVLDEPFDALDAAAVDWLQRLIGARLSHGDVVVLTSHQDCAWSHGPGPAVIDLDAHVGCAVELA